MIVGRGAEQFALRMPDGMRDQIAEAAKANGRSMNNEIIARLEQSFGRDGASLATIHAEIVALRDEVKALRKEGS